MTLPSYVHFTGPLLEYLGEQKEPVRPRAVYEDLAKRLNLSEADRKERLPSGVQTVIQNRVGWAQDALKRAGLSSAPARGTWLITEAGRALLQKYGGRIPQEEALRIGSASRDITIRELEGKDPIPDPPQPEPGGALPDPRSPREQIEDAIGKIRRGVARDLIEQFAQMDPADFEDLVLDVLHGLGYGMTRDVLRRVGRSNDGGIDGIVPLDRLGLQKVYVQAKRWKGSVGSPEVQGFIGALQLQGADKGVLIAAGSISGPAREAARQARGTLVLIDGEELARLMIEHGIAVTSESLKIPKLDSDYFEGA